MRSSRLQAAIWCLLLWAGISTYLQTPHCLLFFNELVGGSRNGHRHLLGSNIDWGQDTKYLSSARQLAAVAGACHVLEIGCGNGELANRLFRENDKSTVDSFHGIDVGAEEVREAAGGFPDWKFTRATAYRLPFEEGQSDLVLMCEVLEHLEDPAARVTRRGLLASVPWEPVASESADLELPK